MRGTIRIPEIDRSGPVSSAEELESTLGDLAAAKDRWAVTSIPARVELLERAIQDTLRVSEEWVTAACRAKGLALDDPRSGEEWQSGPALTIRFMRLMARTLRAIGKTGSPPLGRVSRRIDGTTTVDLFPADRWDSMLFMGVKGQVWMQDGVTPENIAEHTASSYRRAPEPKVALVLGAGNIASIPAMDALTKLFSEHAVVVLKMNPVNAYLGPIFERALAPFVDDGFLSIVYGGADVGARLVEHPLVDSIHITGSDKAHDSIVFGDGEEGSARKSAGRPKLDKPITSELGNVSPVIVVPGPWSSRDIAFQGENLASGLAHNAGFNCVANRVLITHDEWSLRSDLLSSVEEALASIPTRPAYYPGAEQRWQSYIETYGDAAKRIGRRDDTSLPWTLVSVDPDDPSGLCFETECFTSICAEVGLSATSTADFVDRAVRFANERLWGSLGATIIVHPASMRDPIVADAVERAIADLRYGNVSVNIWVAVAFAAVTTTWGPYPGHTPQDIQSGRGVVHNAALLDRPLKSVVRAPFRQYPKPVWFGTNRNAHRALRALTRHEADPGLLSTARVAFQALKG